MFGRFSLELRSTAQPNKALQKDKGKLSCLLHSQSHASLPLPLSLVVRRQIAEICA
jgi:hypothetical protein